MPIINGIDMTWEDLDALAATKLTAAQMHAYRNSGERDFQSMKEFERKFQKLKEKYREQKKKDQ